MSTTAPAASLGEEPLYRAFPALLRPAFAAYAEAWLAGEPQSFRRGELVAIADEEICMPYRLYLTRRRLVDSLSEPDRPPQFRVIALALGSRHHDGFFREYCIRKLLAVRQAWVLPYLLAPLGEYVLETSEVVVAAWADLDTAQLAAFARDNPGFIARTRRRATSYWDCYYRERFPRLADYPPWQALSRLPI